MTQHRHISCKSWLFSSREPKCYPETGSSSSWDSIS